MKLLLDENLSPRLVPRLLSLFGLLTHVRDIGLQQADDRTIWEWAKENGYTVITTDVDFVAISQRLGWPPKIVHVEQCDYPLRVIEDLLRKNALRIADLDKETRMGVLSVRPSPD